VYIFNHFDNGQKMALHEIELKYAKQFILSILPDLNWDEVTSQIKNEEIKLDELLSLL